MNAVKSQRKARVTRFGFRLELPGTRVGYDAAIGEISPELSACACCGSARESFVVERSGSRELAVPYCASCRAHVSKARTRRLAVTLASVLSAMAFGVTLPLVWPELPILGAMAIASLLSAWPLGFELLWPRRTMTPHTALDRAASWNRNGRVRCTRRSFAHELIRASGARSTRLSATPVQLKRYGLWLGLGPALAAVLACAVTLLFTPRLRVLNLGSSTLRIFVNGDERLSLPPTSAESPLAGAELRLGAGFQEIESRTSTGTLVNAVTAQLVAGRRHLYAPGAENTCFWLETTSYGRSGASIERDPLSGEQHFWLLPRNIDLWFSEAPRVPDPSRLSGGQITALRQGPCNPVTVTGQE